MGQWIAGTAVGSLQVVRTTGRLVLTDQRPAFRPLMFGENAGPFKLMFGLTNAVSGLDDHYPARVDITGVEAMNGSALMAVHLQTGGTRHSLVLRRRIGPVFSRKHAPYRDNAVQRISAAVDAVRK
ncbi:hypothetical protein HYE82_30260 [Streptomyces sp. BR123]|uniref:hypothetical protein n=1 Tax=Streptomyces sp. BR123 TaxID=2749828 RepID=UPI0015C4308C|nr:hypothetical protein [Streptomyces sp. BR123]NXY98589.1 hypothetical protein [Streptomyces sp. BR123]